MFISKKKYQALNEKDSQIVGLLKSLPFDGFEDVIGERVNMVIAITLLTGQFKKYDEVIELITSNQGKSFSEVSQLILKSGIFPEVEYTGE
jgi:hypothetical protein